MTHKSVSIAKSIIRLAACVSGILSFTYFCVGFALAELLGILEELVDKRPETKPGMRTTLEIPPGAYAAGMQCRCATAQYTPHTLGEHERLTGDNRW